MAGEHWDSGTLGNVAEIKTGKLDSNAAVLGGRFPFFTCSPETLRIDTVAFDCEAAILAGNNANGVFSVKYFHGEFNAYQRTYVITARDRERIDVKYLYYQLQQLTTLLQEYSIGTATKFLTRTILDPLPIPLPPLPEQKAIAAVLGALDDKIELNRRMNATLEAMARALFQSWFVDFDPVRAKLDGRKPTGIDPDIAALFPEHLEDSPLGQIPHGWEVSRLDEIALVVMGLSPDGESYNAEGLGIPLINGPVEFGDYFPVKTKWTEAATRFASDGDLIFCVRGSTTGRRVVSDGEYGIGRGVCAIRAKGGCHSFLYQTINHGLNRLLEKTTGSVFPSLSAPDIKGFSVLKPSMAILEAYERATKPLIQRIQQNHHQSRTLATLRDTLLPKLLSGELSVAGGSSSELLSGANPRDAKP